MEKRKINPDIANAYKQNLTRHILAVQAAGVSLGVPEGQLAKHDKSKFSNDEFPAYAMHFYGGGDPVAFGRAWLHHIHHNPHHWQHWIFPDGYSPEGAESGRLAMPEHFALEMIADWMGASVVHSKTADMSKWLRKNTPRILLHSETINFVTRILATLGYSGDELAFKAA